MSNEKIAIAEMQEHDSTPGVNTTKLYQARHVPHALSENNIQYFSGPGRVRPADYYVPPYLREADLPYDTEQHEAVISPERGRSTRRAVSPVIMPQVEEEIEEVLELSKGVRKRSRSPHKILFGDNGWLTRSQSVKDIAKPELADEVIEDTPRKSGLKLWRGRMRQKLNGLVSRLTTKILILLTTCRPRSKVASHRH